MDVPRRSWDAEQRSWISSEGHFWALDLLFLLTLSIAVKICNSSSTLDRSRGNRRKTRPRTPYEVSHKCGMEVESSKIIESEAMAEIESVIETDSRPRDGGPLPMKFFSTWEVRKVPPNCVSR